MSGNIPCSLVRFFSLLVNTSHLSTFLHRFQQLFLDLPYPLNNPQGTVIFWTFLPVDSQPKKYNNVQTVGSSRRESNSGQSFRKGACVISLKYDHRTISTAP